MKSKNTDPQVIWDAPSKRNTKSIVSKLKRLLNNHVQSAYLFGSYAMGSATIHSDLDLICVKETDLPWPDRATPISKILQDSLEMPVDILVYTPREWSALSLNPNPLLRSASEHWRKVV